MGRNPMSSFNLPYRINKTDELLILLILIICNLLMQKFKVHENIWIIIAKKVLEMDYSCAAKKKKKQSCGNHLKERERDVNQKPLSQERNWNEQNATSQSITQWLVWISWLLGPMANATTKWSCNYNRLKIFFKSTTKTAKLYVTHGDIIPT